MKKIFHYHYWWLSIIANQINIQLFFGSEIWFWTKKMNQEHPNIHWKLIFFLLHVINRFLFGCSLQLDYFFGFFDLLVCVGVCFSIKREKKRKKPNSKWSLSTSTTSKVMTNDHNNNKCPHTHITQIKL